MAPGVIDPVVLLHTLKFTVLAVAYDMIVSIPVVAGVYPVTAVGSEANEASTTEEVVAPVAVSVCAEVQVAEEIALVARALVPLATV
jgi:hypothetical protein